MTAECWRVLKPTGSLFVNLGDKYAGSGGHNNGGLAKPDKKRKGWDAANNPMGTTANATRRTAPDRYNQASDGIRAKSLMGLPWRYAVGCIDPEYRAFEQWRALGRRADPDYPDTMMVPDEWAFEGILRSEIVWSKPNGLPESVTDRVRRSHEQWFHLTKEGRYYSNVDEVREPSNESERPQARRAAELATAAGLTEAHREALLARGLGDTKKSAITKDGTGKNTAEVMRLAAEADAALGSYAREFTMSAATLGKLPGSVWTVPTQPLIVPEWLDVDHFAAFPTEWPRRLILGWTPPGICVECGEGRTTTTTTTTTTKLTGGADRVSSVPGQPDGRIGARKANHHEVTGTACACDQPTAPTTPAVVLDPFGGTGTVALVARALGRYGVSCDLSADYQRLAKWRIFQSGQAARVAAKTDGERQLSMFQEVAAAP